MILFNCKQTVVQYAISMVKIAQGDVFKNYRWLDLRPHIGKSIKKHLRKGSRCWKYCSNINEKSCDYHIHDTLKAGVCLELINFSPRNGFNRMDFIVYSIFLQQ